jgi:hypothetical protein
MANEKEIALYYPYIDITDAGLIKTAALYWDEIQTIVPQDIYRPYENNLTKEAEREGFLRKRDVTWYDRAVKRAGDEFIQDIETIAEIRRLLLQQSNNNLLRTRVYNGKIALDCRERLLEYFRENIIEEENAYIMPNVLAHSYMSRLASVIAKNDRTIPLTDDHFGDSILESRYLNYSHEQAKNQAMLAKLSLQIISIDPDTPLVNIILFRKKHSKELHNLRRKIRQLSRQIAKGLDNATRQQAFEDLIKDEIIPAKEEIKAKLNENNLQFLAANIILTVAGCAGVAISGEWFGQIVNAGILAGASLIGNIRRERLTVKNHPLGYLYQAQKQFGTNNSMVNN